MVALESSCGAVVDVGGVTVMVFEWIDGDVLGLGPAEPRRAWRIGWILGKIHQLDLPQDGLVSFTSELLNAEQWAQLLDDGLGEHVPWGEEVRDELPSLVDWCRDYESSDVRVKKHLVASHCDLDQKNVFWIYRGLDRV